MATMRDASRKEFTTNDTLEAINAGSLQRIADATEKMAGSWTALVADRDRYKRWYQESNVKISHLENRVRALRGAVTKAKNRRKAA